MCKTKLKVKPYVHTCSIIPSFLLKNGHAICRVTSLASIDLVLFCFIPLANWDKLHWCNFFPCIWQLCNTWPNFM